MRIAVIGAGFSGLSVAWYLLQMGRCEVVVFDGKGVGGGASGVAAGLLHPYVGEDGRRSLLATEAMRATRELVKVSEEALGKKVALQNGILRYVQDEEKNSLFLSHAQEFGDVTSLGDKKFCMESGMTVDCPLYLQGLLQAVIAKGGKLLLKEILDLKELKEFDHVVVAAGSGIGRFPELTHFRVSMLKGQVLQCHLPEAMEGFHQSVVGKGYIAISQQTKICHIGSTYERGVADEIPDVEKAKQILFPKIRLLYPAVDELEIINCRAALRVIRSGHYFPIAEQVQDKLWVLIAMGSRGLLYHACLGRLLAEVIHQVRNILSLKVLF